MKVCKKACEETGDKSRKLDKECLGLRDGWKTLAWYGTVWCGVVWLANGYTVGDHPLAPCPLCLCEDLHERALCSGPAGAPVSE